MCACVSHFECGASGLLFGKNANIFHLHSIFIYSSRKSFRVKPESSQACRQPLWSWAISSNRNAVRLFTRPATQAEIHFCGNQAVAVWQDTMQVWASCVNNSRVWGIFRCSCNQCLSSRTVNTVKNDLERLITVLWTWWSKVTFDCKRFRWLCHWDLQV